MIVFAGSAQAEGVSQATLSGGDPLFHPEMVAVARGLTELGLKVKLDTVDTALLGPAQVVFKGHGRVAKIEVGEISPHVDFVNIPLDGARQETVESFRRGRGNLLAETREVARLLRNAGITFGSRPRGSHGSAAPAHQGITADGLEIVEATVAVVGDNLRVRGKDVLRQIL